MIREIALDHGDDASLCQHLQSYQIRALERIATCGTPAAGMHRDACDACGDVRLRPNTCGSRSCPHCQGSARAEWVAERLTELLPCNYFHVVLTLPPELRGLAMAFTRVVLGALISAAGEAIDFLCREGQDRHILKTNDIITRKKVPVLWSSSGPVLWSRALVP